MENNQRESENNKQDERKRNLERLTVKELCTLQPVKAQDPALFKEIDAIIEAKHKESAAVNASKLEKLGCPRSANHNRLFCHNRNGQVAMTWDPKESAEWTAEAGR